MILNKININIITAHVIGILQLVERLTQIENNGSSKNGQHMLLRSIYHIYDFFTKDRSFSKQKVLYSKGQ